MFRSRSSKHHGSIEVKKQTSFPEFATSCSDSTDFSQEDELLLHDDHDINNDHQSTSFQDLITTKLQKTLLGESKHEAIQKDINQWEEKLKADALKSKAVRLHQLKRAKASSASSVKARKSLSRDVVAVLEEMEYDAEEEIRRLPLPEAEQEQQQQQARQDEEECYNTNVQESQTKYKESLYQLGIIERKISDHNTAIRKYTKKSARSVGITLEHRQRIQHELQHHKLELARAESEMIETRKVVDALLRQLFLLKLQREVEVQEESVRVKMEEVRKWEIVLRRVEEEIVKSSNRSDDSDDCSSSSSSSCES